MHFAAEKGKELRLRKLLSGNVNARDEFGHTALWFASYNGHLGCVKMLLDAKADVNAECEVDGTALFAASQENHLAVVETLIAARANVNQVDEEERTALFVASARGHTLIVSALLEARALPTPTDDICPPLVAAAREGHLEVMRALIDAKADIDQPSGPSEPRNLSPLATALTFHQRGAVSLLLDAKADVRGPGDDCRSIINLAIRVGADVATLKELIAAGADVHVTRADGWTTLHEASRGRVAAQGEVKFLRGFEEPALDRVIELQRPSSTPR
jgi:serine/threonine-protein phosphatase 6 regulatory ankyrin repeat subunit B